MEDALITLQPSTNYAPLVENLLLVEPPEQTCLVEDIQGHIPEFVQGSYYLNSPTGFARPNFRYRHWLDGDGMVSSLRFENGSVRFVNRYVRTTKFVKEAEAERPLFRTFGTSFPEDRLRFGIGLESPANVSVYRFGDRLLAFGEQGLPWELHPATLETRGVFDFSGRIRKMAPFSAHPKFDTTTGEMFNFGVWFSSEPRIYLYRFDSAKNTGFVSKGHAIEHACSIHDFGLSENFAVFYLSPYVLNTPRFLKGASLMESLEWRPELETNLVVLSKQTGELVSSVRVGNRYCLHLINCFESAGRLCVDFIELDRPIYDQYQTVPDLFVDVPQGRPVRLQIDVQTGQVLFEEQVGYYLAPDFPTIDPLMAGRLYDDFWMLGISSTGHHGRKFFDELVHARWSDSTSLDVYHAPSMHYLGGEPIFIREAGRSSSSGVVICQLLDAETRTASFAIFNAFQVNRGPMAIIRLPEPIPPGFHASFYRS